MSMHRCPICEKEYDTDFQMECRPITGEMVCNNCYEKMCELCGEISKTLQICKYTDGEKKALCPVCYDKETTRGDLEAERGRDE